MSTVQDPIDQLFSFTLNGIAYTVEIVGKCAPEVVKFFMGLTHQGARTKGEIKLHNLLRRGSPMEALNIRENDFERFAEAAKKSGLLYSTVCMDDQNPEGSRVYTVYFSQPDLAIVNNILQVQRINSVKAASFQPAPRRDAAPPETAQGPITPTTPGSGKEAPSSKQSGPTHREEQNQPPQAQKPQAQRMDEHKPPQEPEKSLPPQADSPPMTYGGLQKNSAEPKRPIVDARNLVQGRGGKSRLPVKEQMKAAQEWARAQEKTTPQKTAPMKPSPGPDRE